MRGRVQLTRCSLRGAKTSRAGVYNEVVQLMHERNSGHPAQRDGLHGSLYLKEIRRRPWPRRRVKEV